MKSVHATFPTHINRLRTTMLVPANDQSLRYNGVRAVWCDWKRFPKQQVGARFLVIAEFVAAVRICCVFFVCVFLCVFLCVFVCLCAFLCVFLRGLLCVHECSVRFLTSALLASLHLSSTLRLSFCLLFEVCHTSKYICFVFLCQYHTANEGLKIVYIKKRGTPSRFRGFTYYCDSCSPIGSVGVSVFLFEV